MINFHTFFAATAIVFGGAGGTLNKQKMACAVPAIGVCICRMSALVTMRNNLSCDGFTQPFVEDKIFPAKLVLKPLLTNCISVMNDTAFQVEDFLKPLMKQISTCFFTTNTACAIHDDRTLCMFL